MQSHSSRTETELGTTGCMKMKANNHLSIIVYITMIAAENDDLAKRVLNGDN